MKDEDKTKEQLVDELAELRWRIAALEASETERKRTEDHGLEFLSETATEFVEFPLAGDIYRFIGEKLKELVGNSVVAVNSFDEASDSLCIRALLGLGKRIEAVTRIMGGDPVGMSFEIDDQAKRELTLGKLMKVPGGVYDLSPGVPKAVWRALEKLLGLGDVYAMGFAREGQLFGNAVVLLRKGERLENQDIIETFIRWVAVALQRKQAEEEIRRRTFQLEALQQVSLGLAAQVDLHALLRSIVARAVALLKGTGGGLYLYRPEQDVLEWTATIGPHLAPTGTILRRGEGLSGKVWESGEPILVDDYQHWEGRTAIHEDYPFRSVVGVPVLWGGEFLGVLNVLAFSPHTFSPSDAELLSLFATQAAIAIENARLFEQEREQRELSEALEEAAAAVSGTLELEQVLDRILEQVERVIAGDAFSVFLIEGDAARLARWRGYELPGEKAQPLRFEIPIAKYPNLKKMARTGKPVVVQDTSVDSEWVPAARDQGWRRSYVGVPIQVGGVAVGFLNVSGTRPAQLGPDDARRLEAFASHAATAIKNARLFQAEREQRELAEALAEAAAVVGSTLNLDQVLATVLEEVRHLLDVVACSVWLVEPEADELVCRQAVGPQSEVVRGWRLALGEGLAGWVARNGESLTVSDARADERHFKGVDHKTGLVLRSILSVPLRVKESVIGVLQVVDTEVERFGSAELALLEPLATTAAIAIENARLYEQARHDAETRAILLQEVNHRVKNNLTAIIGLLYAEQRYTRVEDQPAYRTMMKDLANRIHGLAKVHTMLSATEWAPLPLDELTRQIIQVALQMLPLDKQVSVDVTPSPVRVTPKQASSLALVINELATNTVKYALAEREPAHISVRIACEDEDDTVLFEFRDNGSGYPGEVLRLESHNVGLYLIQTMVREGLGGEVALCNDDGAVTTIQFKKAPSDF
jgi:GAF domain-containing protein